MKTSIFKLTTVTSQDDYSNFQYFLRELFIVLRSSQVWYPEIFRWYSIKFSPGLNDGLRNILFYAIDNEIAGTALIKNTVEEKKICTFIVKNQYRNNGIGKTLFGKCLEILNTDKPMITVPAERLNQFSKIFKYYDLKLEQVVENYYRSQSKEYVFNGNLDLKTLSHCENSIQNYDQFLQKQYNLISVVI
jgi:predicted acetyltransferase